MPNDKPYNRNRRETKKAQRNCNAFDKTCSPKKAFSKKPSMSYKTKPMEKKHDPKAGFEYEQKKKTITVEAKPKEVKEKTQTITDEAGATFKRNRKGQMVKVEGTEWHGERKAKMEEVAEPKKTQYAGAKNTGFKTSTLEQLNKKPEKEKTLTMTESKKYRVRGGKKTLAQSRTDEVEKSTTAVFKGDKARAMSVDRAKRAEVLSKGKNRKKLASKKTRAAKERFGVRKGYITKERGYNRVRKQADK